MENFFRKVRERGRKYFEQFGFDEETIDALLEEGIKNLKVNLNTLQTYLQTEKVDLDQLAITTHAIKGILVNMGIEETGRLFKEIQLMVIEEEPERKILESLKRLFAKLEKE